MNFTLQGIVNEYKDKDLIDITIGLSKQIEWLEKANTQRLARYQGIKQEQVLSYLAHLLTLSKYISSGKPSSDKSFKEFEPIIKSLVAKGELKVGALADFE